MRLTFFALFLLSPLFLFAQQTESDDSLRHLCVNGIMGDVVIVDNIMLKKGDTIKGAKVLEIYGDSIKFEYKGKTFIKELGQDCIAAEPRKKKIKREPKKRQPLSSARAEELFKEAKDNYLNAVKSEKARRKFKKNSEDYNREETQACIYYKKALKYAQWAFASADKSRKKQLEDIIRDCRQKQNGLESAQTRIEDFRLPYLKNPKGISKWMKENITYKRDLKAHGERDYWQHPKETVILGSGDCEDSAFLAQALLKRIGIDSEVITVQYIRSGEDGSHALCVFPKNRPRSYFTNHILRTGKKDMKDIASDYVQDRVKKCADWKRIYRMQLFDNSYELLLNRDNPL